MNQLTDTGESILTFAMDGDMPICMTEGMLDEWWCSKSPAEKADLWHLSLYEPAAADTLLDPEDLIQSALEAMRHPLNAIHAEAERIASEHHRLAVDAIVDCEHTLHRCYAHRDHTHRR